MLCDMLQLVLGLFIIFSLELEADIVENLAHYCNGHLEAFNFLFVDLAFIIPY
jgi:hypothetical protein